MQVSQRSDPHPLMAGLNTVIVLSRGIDRHWCTCAQTSRMLCAWSVPIGQCFAITQKEGSACLDPAVNGQRLFAEDRYAPLRWPASDVPDLRLIGRLSDQTTHYIRIDSQPLTQTDCYLHQTFAPGNVTFVPACRPVGIGSMPLVAVCSTVTVS